MPHQRWRLGAVLVATLLTAGCAGSPIGDQTLADESGQANVEAGAASSFRLEAQGAITLEYQASVADGPNIDVFVMDETNYQAYSNGEEFEYLACSSLGTGSASGTCELPQGSYRLVLDNTDAGQAQPADISTGSQQATVDYSFTATA